MCGGCRFLWYLHNPKTKNIKKHNENESKSKLYLLSFPPCLWGYSNMLSSTPFAASNHFEWKYICECVFFIKIEGRLQNLSRLSWVSSLCVRHACILDTTCTHEHTYNTYMHRRPFSPIAYVNIYKEISMKEIKQICA